MLEWKAWGGWVKRLQKSGVEWKAEDGDRKCNLTMLGIGRMR